ncbi:MAG TPA: CRTAC1 family protein, partial [Vicinamibacteria bacterium]
GQPNLLFRNDGPGPDAASPWKFRELSREAGVLEPEMSFATWFFDYNNDGWLDLFVGAWDAARLGQVAALYLNRRSTAERPRLYLNLGDGRFEDVTGKAGLDRVLLAMGANFGDIDNDGFEDVYVGTGATDLWMLIPNRMFRNDGGGRFQDVTTSGGFGHLQKGHGISFGDVDEDGDQEVYAVMGGWFSGDGFPNALFENPGHGNHWITLQLEGVRSNRLAMGTRIQVTVRTESGDREIHRVVGTGGSFGSSSLQQEIGLGRALSIRSLRIEWPASGVVQVFHDLPMDREVRIREGTETWVSSAAESFSFPDSKETAR